MKTVITFTVHADAPFTKEEKSAMRHLFADALGEFVAHRDKPVEEYVERRYGWMNTEQQEAKVAETKTRCKVARRLHNAALSFEITEE